MRPSSYQNIRRIFESLLDLTQTRRGAAVIELHDSDPTVADEIDQLILAHVRRAGFLERSPLPSLPTLPVSPRGADLSGSTIGPYRLLHLVGEGGMGEVWYGEQTWPIQRRVAVKLIKAGMDSSEVLSRFESERQALARMEHPAIAQVFDAGSTPEGRPYFAMEYVAGIPLTTYCDHHRLSIHDRLELFIRVCDGVQHAHQKAIIHRDLKPSNILVVEVDGRPVPKIIDFGVARATSHHYQADSGLTQVGAIVGTPGYMSPEQANSAGADIDTRTDVYSLGVILYELMVGALPFELRRLGLGAILRLLREADPPSPSARFRSLPQPAAIASNRHTQPDKLVRKLRGDLDAIALNALEKDRTRRYGTPSELSADIGRYLRSEPILARPANFGYKARKYVRRHAALVASIALGAVLLMSFGITEAIQVRRITRERDRADRIASFMTGMFKVSDPVESRGRSIAAREILDRSSRVIDTELANDPELQSQLMEVMGSVYYGLGLYSQAESLQKRTLQIRLRTKGKASPATAEAMSNLANTLDAQGRRKEAGKLDEQAFSIRLRRLGPEHPDTLKSMNTLAVNLIHENRYREAEQLHRKILAIRRRVLGPEHPDTLRSLDNLGSTLDEEGRYPEAEALEREALAIKRRVLGPDHPQTLQALHHLADTLYGEGRYSDAARLHREEMTDYLRVLGPEHADTLNAMVALANALDDEGKYSEAESLERQAIDVQRRVLGAEHHHTLLAMNNLAETLGDEGKYQEAETIHRDVAASRARILGPRHAHTLYSNSKLAWVLILRGRLTEAERLSNETRERQIQVLGLDHPDTAETTYNLACIAARRGKPTEALTLLQNALDHGLKPRAILRIQTDANLSSLRGRQDFHLLEAYARQSVARQNFELLKNVGTKPLNLD